MSEIELWAERDARAADQEAARQREQARIQKIRDNFAEKFNGTFASVAGFLDDYKYRREENQIACRIVYEHLHEALERNFYRLDGCDAAWFLHVYAKLTQEGAMAFPEVQTYISALKERVEDAD